jgi:hypothetical protein
MKIQNLENIIMSDPSITPILVSEITNERISGFELDGGALKTFEIDPNQELFANGKGEIAEGSFAVLDLDENQKLKKIKVKALSAMASIVKLREFEIVAIEHTSGNIGGPYNDGGRNILLKGTDADGAQYVMPVLLFTSGGSWMPRWDLCALEKCLQQIQIAQYEGETPDTRLSHEITSRAVYAFGNDLRPLKDKYNDIFYLGERDTGTVFDSATSFTIKSLKVSQTGASTRAQMIVAAFIANEKSTLLPLAEAPEAKRGMALLLPYFEIDQQKIFIRTSTPS